MYLYTAYVFSPYHSYLTNQSRYMLLYHTTWLYTSMPNYNGTISHSGWHWVYISYYTILNGYILYYLYHNTSLYPTTPFYIDTNYHTKLPLYFWLTYYMVTSYHITLPLNILSYYNIWVNPTSPHFYYLFICTPTIGVNPTIPHCLCIFYHTMLHENIQLYPLSLNFLPYHTIRMNCIIPQCVYILI